MKKAIVTVGNDGYMPFIKRMIKTLLKTNDMSDKDLIVLYNEEITNLSESSQEELRQIYPEIIFRNVIKTEMLEKIINRFKKTIHLADRDRLIHTIWEFEIFRMEEYDKILYIDGDTLILKDLSILFDLSEYFPLLMCEDQECTDFTRGVKKYKGQYLNSGMMVIRPKKLHCYDKLMNTALEMRLFPDIYGGAYFDQDIINCGFKQYPSEIRPSILPKIYNCWSTSFSNWSDEDVEDELKNIYILHYVTKPFKEEGTKKLDEMWQKII